MANNINVGGAGEGIQPQRGFTSDAKADISDKQTLLAVLQFLRKNNLKGTEELLKRETGVSECDVKQESGGQSESEVSHALAAYKSDDDPSKYDDQLTDLKNFIESCLDVHKVELATILYPVFVHMYLELVYNNHEQHAKLFYHRYSLQLEEYYHEDLTKLSTVTKPEHMKGNQLMENFKSSKFVLKMSRDSYTHLKRYLQEKQLNLLLNVIQEHLFIDVFDGIPRTKQQIDSSSGGLLGEAAREANKTKIYYGLLKEPDLNIPADEDDDAAGDGEDKPKLTVMISRNILFLAFLYFLQGLPYGLQSRFLPLYFRTHGMSLSDIGFFKLLLIPWMLKALWAPFVDRYGSKRQWLSYSMLGLCICCLLGSATSPDHVIELAGVLFLFNLLTATQDIAVDGIAIQVLLTSELASGNIAQVVGYKVGAVFSGGFLTWLSETLNISWGGLFVSLCGAYLAAYFCVISTIPSQDADKINAYLEESIEVTNTDKSKPKKQTSNKLDAENKQEAKRHWFIEHILQVVETDETKWMLLYVLLYKLGEQGTLSMVPLFLVDRGIPAASVGFWTGVIGQCLSIGGSVLGGWMVTYYGWTPFQIVKLFSRFRIIPLVALTSIVWYYDNLSIIREEHSDQRLLVSMVICMCVMLLGSGIVTTTTFTLMMYCSQKSSPIIQASHYTTLATVEVLGKLTFSVLIGSLTDLIGYSLVFSLFIMLGLVVLPVLMKCPKSLVDMNSNENKNS